MPNHVHLVAVPREASGLRIIGEAHRRYTRYLNKKMGWQGYLWQGRFASYPMDARYTYEAVRYVEMNPVRAGLCPHPTEYRWSSARQRVHHQAAYDFRVASHRDFFVEDWESYWLEALERDEVHLQFEENETRERPMGISIRTQ